MTKYRFDREEIVDILEDAVSAIKAKMDDVHEEMTLLSRVVEQLRSYHGSRAMMEGAQAMQHLSCYRFEIEMLLSDLDSI